MRRKRKRLDEARKDSGVETSRHRCRTWRGNWERVAVEEKNQSIAGGEEKINGGAGTPHEKA